MPIADIKSWNDDPDFQALPYQEKQRIVDNYFHRELADSEFFALPYEEQDRIKGNFAFSTIGEDPTPPPPEPVAPPEPETPSFGDQVKDVPRQVGRGLTHGTMGVPQAAGTAIEYAGQRIKGEDRTEEYARSGVAERFMTPGQRMEAGQRTSELRGAGLPLDDRKEAVSEVLDKDRQKREQAGEAVSDVGRTAASFWKEKKEPYGPPDWLSQKNVWDDPEILGSPTFWAYNTAEMLPALAASMLPAAGTYKAIQVGGKAMSMAPKVVAGLARFGAGISGGIAGGTLEASQTYEAVLEQGGSEEEAARAAELMGFFVGGLNAISTGNMFAKAGPGFMTKIRKFGLDGVVEGITEGLEEPAEVVAKIGARIITGQPVPENITELFYESLKDAVTVAPIAALTGGMGGVMGGAQKDLLESATDNKIVDEINNLTEDPEKEESEEKDYGTASEAQIRNQQEIEKQWANRPQETRPVKEAKGSTLQYPKPEAPTGLQFPDTSLDHLPQAPTGEVPGQGVDQAQQQKEVARGLGLPVQEDIKGQKPALPPGQGFELQGDQPAPLPKQDPMAGMQKTGTWTHDPIGDYWSGVAQSQGIAEPEPVEPEPDRSEYWAKQREKLGLDDEQAETEDVTEEDFKRWRQMAQGLRSQDIDAKANEAATSTENDLPEPSEAQQQAGNYKKGHITVNGLEISIENPEGSTRKGVDEDGKAWESTMHGHYGYFKRTEGKDGDQVDVVVGPDQADSVFIVDQVNPKTGEFDEHKVIMGVPDEQAARDLYLSNYEKDWKGLGAITEVGMRPFKRWLGEGKHTKPFNPSMRNKPEKTGIVVDEPKPPKPKPKGKDHKGIVTDGTIIKEPTKREKALKEYNDYVASLSTEQREAVSDLIEKDPKRPSGALFKLRKEVDGLKAKPVETEPWRLTKRQYQMERAKEAGGVPILNARDGDVHRNLVKQALNQGHNVPAHVLKDYPELQEKPKDTRKPFEIPLAEYLKGKTDKDEIAIAKVGHVNQVRMAAVGGKAPLEVLEDYKHNEWAKRAIEKLKPKKEPEKPKTEPTGKPGSSDKLALWVQDRLKARESFGWRPLFKAADRSFQGTQAEGAYTPKDAYDAVELGINRFLNDQLTINPNTIDDRVAVRDVKALTNFLKLIPTQTRRTQEQQEFQQFSTPPPFAFVANWVANIGKEDVYLEPSAGIGGIAVFGQLAGAKKVYVNELSPRRAELLKLLGFDKVFTENAEQLDNILPTDIKPTVIVMNPPFSATGGRLSKNQTKYGARHIEQALERLEHGGRLVSVVGQGMAEGRPAFADWWKKIKSKYTVRANIGIAGEAYAKYGTSFDNQLLVIDKIGPGDDNVLTGKVKSYEELIPLLKGVRDERTHVSEQPQNQPVGESGSKGSGSKTGPGKSVRPPTSELGPGESELEGEGQPPLGPGGRDDSLEAEQGDGSASDGTRDRGESGSPTGNRSGTDRSGKGDTGTGERLDGGERTDLPGSDELSLDDLSDLIDEIGEEEGLVDKPTEPTPLPKNKKTVTGEDLRVGDRVRWEDYPGAFYVGSVTNIDSQYVKIKVSDSHNEHKNLFQEFELLSRAKAPKKKPSIKKAAKHTVKGTKKGLEAVADILKGLNRTGTVSPGGGLPPLIAPEAYAAAKEHLAESYLEFKQAGNETKEWVRHALIELKKMGAPFDIAKNWVLNFYASDRPTLPEEPTAAEPIKIETVEHSNKAEGELTDSLFEAYKPSRLRVKGAKTHIEATNNPLVESAAMAAVPTPKPTYSPRLPANIVETGLLTLEQIEQVVMAGQSHELMLPTGERKGYFIGDGTGVGKGRTIAGIVMDNWNHGRKKSVWVSKNRGLLNDAKRDTKAIGFDAPVFLLNNTAHGESVSAKTGIMFVPYATLPQVSKTQKVPQGQLAGRLKQVVDWFGKDYDGVIAFDEAHKMGNAIEQGEGRYAKKPSKMALAAITLQKELPQARVVYVSATGATEVRNLAYAERLGLWGDKTAFRSKHGFIANGEAGGVAAMELIARDMKAMGSYLARSLSYDGVEYDKLTHELTDKQVTIYDDLVDAWQVVIENIEEAVDETMGRFAESHFWSANQRFWNQVITAMQMPTVLRDIHKVLDSGESAVIQLVNTNAAAQDRQVARATIAGDSLETIDFTPREIIIDYVRSSFPVQQFEEYEDEDGNIQTRPVTNAEGEPVMNQAAIRKRDALIERLGLLQVPHNPLDSIIEEYGTDMVAEITGRAERYINGKREKRSEATKKKDVKAFMNGDKRVLVFSGAGATGASYHADLGSKNQQMRNHYILQAGWRADEATQGFGRTHRANQKQPPRYKLVSTNLHGQKRFVSSIARRLDQLGALTKGQREAGSQGMFTASDNLEGQYATHALAQLVGDLDAGDVESMTIDEFESKTGIKLRKEDDDGNIKLEVPSIKKFLNRILNVSVDFQNKLFREFDNRLTDILARAEAAGNIDKGIEVLKAESVKIIDEKTIYHHDISDTDTKLYTLETTHKRKLYTWPEVHERYVMSEDGEFKHGYWKNLQSGNVFAVLGAGTKDMPNGSIEPVVLLKSTNATYIKKILLKELKATGEDQKYEKIPRDQAQKLWNQQYKEADKFLTREEYFISGVILPIWDKIKGKLKVFRVQTDDGQRMIGRVVTEEEAKDTMRSLGVSIKAPKLTPDQAVDEVLVKGSKLVLSNDWKLERRKVSDENRIEIVGDIAEDFARLKEWGAFTEMIGYKTRAFIPTVKRKAIGTYNRIVANFPVVDIIRSETREDTTSGGILGNQRGELNLEGLFTKDLPDNVSVQKSQDMGRRERITMPPHWLAKKHPEFNVMYKRQQQRVRDRMAHLAKTMQEAQKFFDLKHDDIKEVRNLIFAFENQQVKGVTAKKFKKDPEGNYILNDQYYDQYRKALDKLSITTKVKDAYIDLRKTLDVDLATVFNAMAAMKDIDDTVLEQMRTAMGQIHNYFPHMRYGKYFIQGIDRTSGDVVYREHFDAPAGYIRKGKRLIRENEAKLASKNVEWKIGKVERMPEEVFAIPVPIEALEAVMNAAIDRLDDAKAKESFRSMLPQAVADALKTRGWGSHMINRKNIPGFETERIQQVLFDYKAGLYGWLTKMETARDFSLAMSKIKSQKKPVLWGAMRQYAYDMLENADRVDNAMNTLRGVFFAKYLGLNVKTAVLNTTQNIIAGWPRLSMEVGNSFGKVMGGAASDLVAAITKGKNLSADEQLLLQELFEEGTTNANFLNEVRGSLEFSVSTAWQKTLKVMGLPMQIAEKFNRCSLALAAYRSARAGKVKRFDKNKVGHNEAKTFAEEVVEDAHFVYGKTNRPEMFRGPVGKVASLGYTFRTFTHNLVNLWTWMIQNGGKAAVMRSVAATIAIGGISSIPLYKTFMHIVRQLTGDDPEEELVDLAPDGLRDLLLYGVPAAAGVNLGGSIGMELPIFDKVRLDQSIAEQVSRNAGEIIGIPYAIVEDIESSIRSAAAGQGIRAVEKLLPTAIANPLKAYREYNTGQTSISGKPINLPGSLGPRKLTGKEAIGKLAGFQPVSSTKSYNLYQKLEDFKAFKQGKQKEFANRITNSLRQKDMKAYGKVMGELVEWNKEQMADGNFEYVITGEDITRSLQARSKAGQPPVYMMPKALRLRKKYFNN